MPFIYIRRVRLEDTDAVGVIFFTNQLKFSMESFEELLISKDITIDQMVLKKDYLLPIVHTEGDFFIALRQGDLLEIETYVSHIGTSSFSISSTLRKKGSKEIAGTAKIVHVAISKITEKSLPIPQEVVDVLSQFHLES